MTTTYTCDINANGTAISAPVYGNGTAYYRLQGNNVDYIHKYNSADLWIDTFCNIRLDAKFTALQSDCNGYYLTGQFWCTYVASYDDQGSEGTYTKTVSLYGNNNRLYLILQTSSDKSNWNDVASFHLGSNNYTYQATSETVGTAFSMNFISAQVSYNPVYYRFIVSGSGTVTTRCSVNCYLAGYANETPSLTSYRTEGLIAQGTVPNYSGTGFGKTLVELEDTYSYTGPYQEY